MGQRLWREKRCENDERMTPKQERFCQAYIETGNASEAYRQAYNADKMQAQTIHVKASELLASGKVAVRLEELNRAAQMRHLDTVDSLCEELNNHREQAIQTAQLSAANQATLGKARLLGYLADRPAKQEPIRVQVITGVPRNPV